MRSTIQTWLTDQGLTDFYSFYGSYFLLAIIVVIVSWLFNFIAKKVILAIVTYFIRQSKTKWDDILLEKKVFIRLSHFVPALVIYYSSGLFGSWADSIQRLSMVYMMLAGYMVINSFFNAIIEIYRSFDIAKQRPIKSYVQIGKIIIFVFIAVIAISVLMDRSPWLMLSGLGAMTAVILLIFKDSILGLVASIQLSMNNMVQVGDWIEMPKFGADGDVIDISLHTVKIQNWDKTISTIPAYSMITDAFKNWRGMSESGGRRIKRSINIDINSIRFLDGELLARFEKIQILNEYIKKKKDELAEHNKSSQVDDLFLINGRHMTNIGTFRAYIQQYLRNHPKIHQEMTFLVRQLPSGPNGLPIEIYVFSNDQDWVRYEAIQADIFDHFLAIIPIFDLRVFQYPTDITTKSIIS
jgi:miniconductance mechanosensitive channel